MLIYAPGNTFLNNLVSKNKLGLFSSTNDDIHYNLDLIFNDTHFFSKYGLEGLNIIKKKFSTSNAINKLLLND